MTGRGTGIITWWIVVNAGPSGYVAYTRERSVRITSPVTTSDLGTVGTVTEGGEWMPLPDYSAAPPATAGVLLRRLEVLAAGLRARGVTPEDEACYAERPSP